MNLIAQEAQDASASGEWIEVPGTERATVAAIVHAVRAEIVSRGENVMVRGRRVPCGCVEVKVSREFGERAPDWCGNGQVSQCGRMGVKL